jgi:predicted RNA binding protein YcfA (HicA-like mRNA interferase family)
VTAFSREVFDRLKNISKQDFIKALERDGFLRDVESRQGAILVYRHPDGRRVTVHWHPKTGFGRERLHKMLAATRWGTRDDLVRVGIIKR